MKKNCKIALLDIIKGYASITKCKKRIQYVSRVTYIRILGYIEQLSVEVTIY